MKNLICILFATLLSVSAFAQERLSFVKVIPAEGVKKEALYVAIRSFVASYYHDSQNVIQMDDKDAGMLMGKATSVFDSPGMVYSSYEGYLDYSFKMQAKDDRIRVEISNFFHQNKVGNAKKSQLGALTTAEQYSDKGLQKKYDNKVWGLLKEQAQEVSDKIFAGVEKSITENATSGTTEEEW